MTTVINKFQRMLRIEILRKNSHKNCMAERERPVVFITHMEHHSNHTSWYETNAEVVIVEPGPNLLVEPENLRKALEKYKDRNFKIGSFHCLLKCDRCQNTILRTGRNYARVSAAFVLSTLRLQHLTTEMICTPKPWKNWMPSCFRHTNFWVVLVLRVF
jgi:hypothetical protein